LSGDALVTWSLLIIDYRIHFDLTPTVLLTIMMTAAPLHLKRGSRDAEYLEDYWGEVLAHIYSAGEWLRDYFGHILFFICLNETKFANAYSNYKNFVGNVSHLK
jgi:hypothetical protein